MSEAPEYIWVDLDHNARGSMIGLVFASDVGDVQYIRADIAAAQLAEANARADVNQVLAEARIAELEAALTRAADYIHKGMWDRSGPVLRQARAALEGKT
jgi:hypothetical protein